MFLLHTFLIRQSGVCGATLIVLLRGARQWRQTKQIMSLLLRILRTPGPTDREIIDTRGLWFVSSSIVHLSRLDEHPCESVSP